MYGFAGSTSSPTRLVVGRNSRRSSKRFAASSGAIVEVPVILPPGWDMLPTSPIRTGSPVIVTMGMVVVAFLAASEATAPFAIIASTLSRASSTARPGTSSALPPAARRSTIRFSCSIQPSSRSVSKKTGHSPPIVPAVKMPRRRPFPGCCARADDAVPTRLAATISMNVRRCIIQSPRRRSQVQPCYACTQNLDGARE